MDFADRCWDVASCCRSRVDATARRLPHRSEPTLKEGNAGGGFRLRPFSLPAGERTFGFLAGWISRLLRIGGWTLGGEDPSEIRARVEDLYAFAPERRTLDVLVRSLPSKMWPALGRWHGTGAWAKYFDNAADRDDLNFEDWQVIDMAGAAEHEDLCEAALFYLRERLRLALENPDECCGGSRRD